MDLASLESVNQIILSYKHVIMLAAYVLIMQIDLVTFVKPQINYKIVNLHIQAIHFKQNLNNDISLIV